MPWEINARPCVWGAWYLEQSCMQNCLPGSPQRKWNLSIRMLFKGVLAALTSFSVLCFWRVIQGSLEKRAWWWVHTYLVVSHHWLAGFGKVQRDCKVAPCYLKLLLGFCFLLCFFLIPLRQSRWKKKKRHQVYKFCFVFFTFLTWDTRITVCRKKSYCGIELARKAKS